MRRFQLGLAMFALPVFACTLFVAGCGKDEKKVDNSTNTETNETQSTGPAELLEPKGGVLKGHIKLKEMPNVKDLTEKLRAEIAEKKTSQKVCEAGSETETSEQVYRIGKNQYLGNVFVWVKPVDGTLFKVDQKQIDEAKLNPLVIHQPHCAFIPHCAVVFAEYHPDPKKPQEKKPTGQIIKIKNDAATDHNTAYEAGPKNPHKDEVIPSGQEREVKKLVEDRKEMTFKCGIHPWMNAYVRLLDTPYYAITASDTSDKEHAVKKDDAKFGTYEIKNLPLSKVQVFVWHEKLGFLNAGGGAKGDIVEIKEGGTEKNYEVAPK